MSIWGNRSNQVYDLELALKEAKRNSSDNLEPKLIRITAAQAKTLLDDKIKNRTLRMPVASRYGKIMAARQWDTTNFENPAQLNRVGKLQAGQTRLTGLLLSDLPEMVFPVMFNANESARQLQDSNLAKNVNDKMYMKYGFENPVPSILPARTVLAASKLGCAYDTLNISEHDKNPKMDYSDVSDQNVFAKASDFTSALIRILEVLNNVKPHRDSALRKAPVLCATLVTYQKMDEEKWTEAIKLLACVKEDNDLGGPLFAVHKVMNGYRDNNGARWAMMLTVLGALMLFEYDDEIEDDIQSYGTDSEKRKEIFEHWK